MKVFRVALLSAFLHLNVTCIASSANSVNDDDDDSRDTDASSPYADVPDERLIALFIHPPIKNSSIFVLELTPAFDGLPPQEPGKHQKWFGFDVFPVEGGVNLEAASFSGGPMGAHVECTIFTAPTKLSDGVWELADDNLDLGRMVTFSYSETVFVEGATGYFCSAEFSGDENPGMRFEKRVSQV